MRIKIKVNRRLPGYRVGQVVEVKADAEGTPLDQFWRRRLRDARMDGCCEVVAPPKPKSQRKRLAVQRGEDQ